MFDVIPVIDLMAGVVVHGKGGRRTEYRAVQSDLCAKATPDGVIDGLLTLYPFTQCYVADLDAIAGDANHDMVIKSLLKQFPALTLWVDSGITRAADLSDRIQHPRLRHIVGSETLIDAGELSLVLRRDNTVLLSMDYKDTEFLGDRGLLADTVVWPDQVIVLNLSHVGAAKGPPLTQLAKAAGHITDSGRLIAGGGVRHLADLQQLKAMGYGGALVASALHNGSIAREDLVGVMTA